MAFDSNSIQQNVSGMMEKLEQFLVNKTVVGEKIQIGEVTLIPLLSIGFGVGTGLGDGHDEKNGGAGGGGGMGASVKPIAILVAKGDEIQVVPVKKSCGLEKLVDMVPDLIEKVRLENFSKNNKCCDE